MGRGLDFDKTEETDVNLIIRDKNEKAVYQAIKDGCVNVNGVIADTGLSEPTVRQHINRLLKVGRIRRISTTGPLTFKISDYIQEDEPEPEREEESRMSRLEKRIDRIEKELF